VLTTGKTGRVTVKEVTGDGCRRWCGLGTAMGMSSCRHDDAALP
jgi:hypothetical protein